MKSQIEFRGASTFLYVSSIAASFIAANELILHPRITSGFTPFDDYVCSGIEARGLKQVASEAGRRAPYVAELRKRARRLMEGLEGIEKVRADYTILAYHSRRKGRRNENQKFIRPQGA
jgi:hypothetical protein